MSRRTASLNMGGGFGPPPSTPNRSGAGGGVRSSDVHASYGQRQNSPSGRIGSRQNTPSAGAGMLSGSGYRNSSDGVSAIMGGGAFPGSPSRPAMRPSTQGLPNRAVGTPKTGTGSGSLARTNSSSGVFRGGSGAQEPEGGLAFDCKVLQSGGKSINQPLQLCAGAGETQGMRPTMEDAHLALINLGNASDGQPVSLFAVLDGHCGRRVADLGAHFLPEILMARPNLGTDNATAFAETVVMTDKAVFSQMGRADGGSTLISGMVHGRMLFVANLGDARAVLYDGNSTIAMSVDHKPTDQSEQQRIVRCGSFVHFGRVGACLAVSRALGDFEFKFTGQRYGTEKEFAVGHVPDIRQINLTDSSKFLILACDGLWDVCSNEEATAFVNSFMLSADTRDLEKALNLCSSQLAMHAVERGSMDNVTCMVVWFHAPGGGAATTGSGGATGSTGTSATSGGATSNGASSVGPSSPLIAGRGASRPATQGTQGTPGYRTASGGGHGVGSRGQYSTNNTRLPSLGSSSGASLRRGNL